MLQYELNSITGPSGLVVKTLVANARGSTDSKTYLKFLKFIFKNTGIGKFPLLLKYLFSFPYFASFFKNIS